MEGTVAGLFRRRDGRGVRAAPAESVAFRFGGLEGDWHCGLVVPAGGHQSLYRPDTPVANWRQVSLVGTEELAEIARRLGLREIRPEWVGANVALAGVPRLSRLQAGSRILFAGGASLFVTEENTPCTVAGGALQTVYPEQADLAARFVSAAVGRRGLMASVEREGRVAVGEAFRVREPRTFAGGRPPFILKARRRFLDRRPRNRRGTAILEEEHGDGV